MAAIPLLQRQGVRQLVKFCIVGFSSTVVEQGTLWILAKQFSVLTRFPVVPWWSWLTLTFCLAVFNGFTWNRRWTFRAQSAERAHQQFIKFLATNAVGLLLKLCFSKIFLILLTGKVLHEQNPTSDQLQIASICTIPFIVIWNFSAAKYWTFRAPKESDALNIQSP